jgi:hypothetical protein
MLNRRRPKACRLCAHIKKDGNACGSPALKRRRYCHAHHEQQRRARRIAQYRQIAQLREAAKKRAEEDAMNSVRMADLLIKSRTLKKMILNYFDENTLRNTFGLNPDGSRLCENDRGDIPPPGFRPAAEAYPPPMRNFESDRQRRPEARPSSR